MNYTNQLQQPILALRAIPSNTGKSVTPDRVGSAASAALSSASLGNGSSPTQSIDASVIHFSPLGTDQQKPIEIVWNNTTYKVSYKSKEENPLTDEEIQKFKISCIAHLEHASQKVAPEILKKTFVMQKDLEKTGYEIVPYKKEEKTQTWVPENPIHIDSSPENEDCFRYCKGGFTVDEVQSFCQAWAASQVKETQKNYKRLPDSQNSKKESQDLPPTSASLPTTAAGKGKATRTKIETSVQTPSMLDRLKSYFSQDLKQFLEKLKKLDEQNQIQELNKAQKSGLEIKYENKKFKENLLETCGYKFNGAWDLKKIKNAIQIDINRYHLHVDGKRITSFDEICELYGLTSLFSSEAQPSEAQEKSLAMFALLNQTIFNGIISEFMVFQGNDPSQGMLGSDKTSIFIDSSNIHEIHFEKMYSIFNLNHTDVRYPVLVRGTINDETTSFTMKFLTDPVGIVNSGNDCWLISILQAIRVVPSLKSWIDKTEDKDLKIFAQFYQQYEEARKKGHATGSKFYDITSEALRKALNKLTSALTKQGQEDVAQVFRTLLGKMPKEMQGTIVETKTYKVQDQEEESTTDLDKEPFYSLLLELPKAGNTPKLHEMMEQALGFEEEIEAEPLKDGRTLTRTTKAIKTAPQILMLHVNRAKAEKDSKEIEAQDEISLLIDKDSKKYRLKSFIPHLGESKNAGHYVTYAEENGIRYCYNDEKITKIDQLVWDKSKSQAYVLIYELIS